MTKSKMEVIPMKWDWKNFFKSSAMAFLTGALEIFTLYWFVTVEESSVITLVVGFAVAVALPCVVGFCASEGTLRRGAYAALSNTIGIFSAVCTIRFIQGAGFDVTELRIWWMVLLAAPLATGVAAALIWKYRHTLLRPLYRFAGQQDGQQ